MATISRSFSKKESNGAVEVLLRISAGRHCRVRVRSGIFVESHLIKADRSGLRTVRRNCDDSRRLSEISQQLDTLERDIYDYILSTDADMLTPERLADAVALIKNPIRRGGAGLTLGQLMVACSEAKDVTEATRKLYVNISHSLRRYELYHDKELTLQSFGRHTIADLRQYFTNEHMLLHARPDIADRIRSEPGMRRTPRKPMGKNTLFTLLQMIKAAMNWGERQGLVTHEQILSFGEREKPVYGTPWYLTTEERDTIADHDFGSSYLNEQRDIFVFQCLTGCRVGDLSRLTAANIVDGALEYIPQKTRAKNATTVTVPLNGRAAAIAAEYAGRGLPQLFPCLLTGQYNSIIRRLLTECGITRTVTVIDPTTRADVQRPINEIACSHMARRTFVGNLYRKIKDPEIIGAMSGHAPGSKAFARYRQIDADTKREAIELL